MERLRGIEGGREGGRDIACPSQASGSWTAPGDGWGKRWRGCFQGRAATTLHVSTLYHPEVTICQYTFLVEM